MKRATGRVPPSGFGTWVVAEVVVAGAMAPLRMEAVANPWANALRRGGNKRKVRSLKKLTGSGAVLAGACRNHRFSWVERGSVILCRASRNFGS